MNTVAQRILPTTAGAGLEEVMFLARQRDPDTGERLWAAGLADEARAEP